MISISTLISTVCSSSEAVAEIKQIMNQQFSEGTNKIVTLVAFFSMLLYLIQVKEAWLVNGLFDTYASTKSSKLLDLLLSGARDPHDKFLLDKISESLRQGGTSRHVGLDVLGCVVRKQPSWLLFRFTNNTRLTISISSLKRVLF